ncbi:hypothetical protein BDY24DRAFT_398301 [Mrakia frigida]|uniref:uncharacterized protein n=1 Tax=Mrakia frigida TaxID=29902 RepID=UPI003FCBFA1E
MSDLSPIIRSITPAISIFSIPFKRFGLMPIGGRSTAIKLQSGDIWIYVSTPLQESTKAEIARLGGEVKYLVVPDMEHTMNISAFHKAYPTAICVGPEGVAAKKPDVKFAFEYSTNGLAGPAEKAGFEEEIESCYFKSHANKDLAFLHKPSGTLIEADVLFNLPATEQHPGSGHGILGSLNGHMAPGTTMHKKMIAGIASSDKHAFGVAAAIVAGWSWDRLIPCHGDVLETGGKNAWTSTLGDLIAAAASPKK